MKRRKLITQTTIGVAAVSTLAACEQKPTIIGGDTAQEVEQPLIEWRCATSWPAKLEETVYGGVKALCERISQITDRRFNITPYPSGEIAPSLAILETVQNNKVECGHTSSSYFTKQSPSLAFASTVPFGFNAKQQMAWLQAGGGLELIRKVYADFNVINFPAANSGNQMGGWYNQKITSLDQLKKLKIRLTGLGGEVLKSMGVEIVRTPGDEIVKALKDGTIDAAEWTGPYDDEALGLNEVAMYYYYPGWHQPGTTYDFIINKDAYEKLPLAYQQAIATACTEAYGDIYARYQSKNVEALQRLRSSGTELVAFSKDILTEAEKAAFALYEENANTDATFKEIYNNWKGFRQQIYQWYGIDELSYADFVYKKG